MGRVVVGSSLPGRPSPGSDRPAIDAVTCTPLHPALATMTPCLHFGFCEVARISGRPLGGDRDNGFGRRDTAGDFPVRIPYAID